MKALDTNILARLILADDEAQARLAREYLRRAEAEGESLLVPLVVVLELAWVLRAKYGRSREEIIESLRAMMGTAPLEFEHYPVLMGFLDAALNTNADLADLIIGHVARFWGCDSVMTFDKQAARTEYFELLGP